MIRTTPIVLLVLTACCLYGCAPGEGGDCVIEETGYLEPCALESTEVAWTTFESQIQSVGLPGAAPPLTNLQLFNRMSEESSEASSSETGSFLLALDGELGDELVLSVPGLPDAGEILWEVRGLNSFPDVISITARAASETDLRDVIVEVEFTVPRTDGRVRVGNRANDHVAYLDPFQDGAVHGGRLRGDAGDSLLLFWLGGDEVNDSEALEVVVE